MVMCEGVNEYNEPAYCFCFMRQTRGCNNPRMKVAQRSEREMLNFVKDLIC